MSSDTTSFGDLLRQLRTSAALSQEALAERAGLSLRGISDLERGVRRVPRLTTVGMLANALELGPEDRGKLLTAARPGFPLDRPESALRGFPPFPTPLAALIDRERELAALVSLLGDGAIRLVTLTGAGGSGKTRLALEVGARLRRAFTDGAVFVDLASVRDEDLVIPTIASALGVRERAGQPLMDTLAGVLAANEVVLVLDNCEQVLGAAPDIAALLAASPRVVVLATSREPLRVRGERVFPLLPLPLPEDDLPAVEDLARVPAVALFVERAAASQGDFALTPDNAAAVAAICRRLDGLPLAIELAAARARMLPPQAMLARLEQRLPFLTGGARDAPPRQRTMRDAIAWSYDLLNAEEQRLFRRMAIFVGGWTLEAAEAVSNPAGDFDVFGGLDRLAGHSLVRQQLVMGGDPRFTMLETIREFGLERLAASGEDGPSRQAHAKHFRALAASSFQGQSAGGTEKLWFDRLEVEHDNVRTALDWTLASNDQDLLGFAADLGSFWWSRSPGSEGRGWLERALATDAGEPTIDRARALRWLAMLVFWLGETRQGVSLTEEGLDLARSLGDKKEESMILGDLGDFSRESGDFNGAEQWYLASLALYQDLGAHLGVARNWARLAWVADARGDIVREESLATKALQVFRDHADSAGIADSLRRLGSVAQHRGDLDQAAAYLEEGLALDENLGNVGWVVAGAEMLGDLLRERGDLVGAYTLCERSRAIAKDLGWDGDASLALYRLALVAADAGDVTEAADLCQQAITGLRQSPYRRELAAALIGAGHIYLTLRDASGATGSYHEGLSLFGEIGDPLGQAAAVLAIGELAAQMGRPGEAVQLLAAATAKREAHGVGLLPSERRREARAIELAQAALGEAAFAAEWDKGGNLPWDAAYEEALAATSIANAKEGLGIATHEIMPQEVG